MNFTVWAPLAGVAALLFAFYLTARILRVEPGNQTMQEIAGAIQEGAMAFLKREYKALFVFVLAVATVIFLTGYFTEGADSLQPETAIAFIIGAICSVTAGFIGMTVATKANVRTANAAQTSANKALGVAFSGGAVMGMCVVGLGLVGLGIVTFLFDNPNTINGFALGASSIALFGRVGGGIYTKAADVGADLVGKVEAGIPEDDPRNPAVIADNVGDNVGDVAGMGADLFDSNVASMAAAMVMAIALDTKINDTINVLMVFAYAAIGLLSSIIGVATARMGKKGNPTSALNSSTYVTTFIFAALTALITLLVDGFEWRIWGASTVGLLVGVIIGLASDYFTDDRRRPVHNVAKASESGPAFTILSGVSYGFLSTLPAMIGIALSALIAYKLCEPLGEGYAMFGISMAAVGMLSIVGMIISNDAYGPIVDNARGLAEMGELGEEVIEVADTLDSAGNTVKAVTKGFAIGAAGLTVISLLGAFISEANSVAEELNININLTGFDVMDPSVFFGLLIGAAIPAVFSALLMLGVDRNAQRMVMEIHRQFKEIPGLVEGKEDAVPEYDKCIDIATTGALKELIPAGLFTIIMTVIVGFVGGVKAVGGYLAGNIVSGLLLALFMSNSGGLWDNGKKFVEAGNNGGKGSAAHKAAVVGDTVGDPFKDTAGPSINTQITVVSLIASLLVSFFIQFSIF